MTISAEPAQATVGSTVRVTVTVRHDGGDGSAPTGSVVLSTTLGTFVESGGGNPVQTKELTLGAANGSTSSASTAFQAGDETGTASLLARFQGFTGTFNLAVVEPGVAPKAAFTVQVDGLQALFMDASTGDPDTWEWSFGDPGSGEANASSAQNPSHAFSRAGTFTVTLTASKSSEPGKKSSVSQFVAVSASVTAAFEMQVQGLQVNFTDRSEGGPDVWEWSFGDPASGKANTSAQQNPVHVFSRAGTFTVTLSVGKSVNPNDRSSTSQPVTVARGLLADFSFDVQAFTVTFTDLSAGSPTSWTWDFGDMSAGSIRQNPSHTYTSPGGTFAVTLTVDNAADPPSTVTKQVTVPPAGSRPTADFELEVEGTTVNFTDKSKGDPTSWTWDFDDGSPLDTHQNTSHTYATGGVYRVSLTVKNTSGESSATRTVTVHRPLTADFTTSVDELQVTFTDTSEGNPTAWSWDFGDGGTSDLQNPVHAFTVAGAPTVTLEVSNDAGDRDTISRQVRVGRKPVATFEWTSNGKVFSFVDTSQNNPTSWSWSFGDGTSNNSQNPSHEYAASGPYSVTLTATNEFGSGSVTMTVMVP